MSNVLIGIVGVILFIGLALAGALILGDDFQTAGASSQAAALASQMKQAGDAAMMWKLKTGARYVPGIETDFLVPRFLKTPAVNPTSAAKASGGLYFYQIHFDNDINPVNFREPTQAARMLTAVVGPVSDAKSRNVCQAFADQYGGGTIADYRSSSYDPQPPADIGCMMTVGNPGSGAGDYFVAWQRTDNPSLGINTPSGYSGA